MPTPIGQFLDPAGHYTITPGPTWIHAPTGSVVNGIEFWFVGPGAGGFHPNVDVASQASGGLDLAGYDALSVKNAPKLIAGFRLLSDKTIDTAHGQMLRLEYLGQTATGVKLHFLAYAVLGDGTVDVDTFTTTTATYAGLVNDVEPWLATIAPVVAASS